MSVDKKKWQAIADKYDTKAKWADALLMLNMEDHDDIISALIDLDPQEMTKKTTVGDVTVNIPDIDPNKINEYVRMAAKIYGRPQRGS